MLSGAEVSKKVYRPTLAQYSDRALRSQSSPMVRPKRLKK